ncbi:Ger(x)C family spore germination protein [Paenibacillus eucommiae]|uniref:Spore germination protein KC n=1 Tax=Paenibacillus eucommiae TaxID=1355755 RepID=A0ABS4J4R2_9BACL|nr:Ger(x)C family spore germination protein [Paenibacillus eucommiae]MBP1994820.1 spore germination protein KC [Paenibacillus eucommiae]
MKKKTILFLCFLVAVMLLTGCWSRHELNTLGIVVGIAIDKADKQYEVSVQIVNPSEISTQKTRGSGRTPITVFSAKGDTVAEAVRKLTSVTPRETYFSHVRIFILSEPLAREGVSKLLDYISRDHEFRTDFYFTIAKGSSAKEVLSFMTAVDKISSNKMFNSLEIAEKEWSPVTTIRLDDLIKSIMIKGNNSAITGMRILGNKKVSGTNKNLESVVPPAILQASGLAVFNKDKMVGWLDDTESKGYTNLTDRLQRTVVNVACPKGGKLSVDVTRAQTKFKGKVENGKPSIQVITRVEANVSDAECQIELKKAETLTYLEKEVEKEMKDHSEAALKKAKKLKTDIFGFGEAIHRAAPDYWKKVEKEWGQHFQELSADIQVDVRIKRLGTIGEPLINKLKE